MSEYTGHELGIERAIAIPERAIIVPPKIDAELIAREYLSDAKLAGWNDFCNRGLLTGRYGNEPISIVVCGIGSWSAAEAMATAFEIGVKKAIFYGSCGAVDESIQLGDFIVPTGGCISLLKELECTKEELEEALRRTAAADSDSSISEHLEQKLISVAREPKKGVVYSTDMSYGQEKIMLPQLKDREYIAVERELAAILRRAQEAGARAGALLFVSDRVYQEGESPDSGQYWPTWEECKDIGYKTILEALIMD